MGKRKDENELAKSIIDEIIGETESDNWCGTLEPKAKAGRLGGKKRAANLTAEERSESARKAAQDRWRKES